VVDHVSRMKTYGGVKVQHHIFLTSVLDGGEWSTSRLALFTPGKYWTGGGAGLGTGLDAVTIRNPFTAPTGDRAPVLEDTLWL